MDDHWQEQIVLTVVGYVYRDNVAVVLRGLWWAESYIASASEHESFERPFAKKKTPSLTDRNYELLNCSSKP